MAKSYLDLLKAQGLNVNDAVYLVIEGGAPRIITGRITDFGVAGGIEYVSVVLDKPFGTTPNDIPIGRILHVVAEKIVAFSEATPPAP